MPDLGGAHAVPGGAPSLDRGDEVVELRPSPRFDCVEGLARLAVLPVDANETRSRAGIHGSRGHEAAATAVAPLDLSFALVVAGYVAAAVVAAIIVLH